MSEFDVTLKEEVDGLQEHQRVSEYDNDVRHIEQQYAITIIFHICMYIHT